MSIHFSLALNGLLTHGGPCHWNGGRTLESVLTRLIATRPTIGQTWTLLKDVPGGKYLFSKMIGQMAPYTSTIDARVKELDFGHAVVALQDRKPVRNHLNSLHAIALMNLGEVSTGLAVLYAIDGRGRGIIRNLSMDYLKKARGTITATCDAPVPNSSGDHDVKVESLLHDEAGFLVARATAIWKITID